ncbi:Lipopolysaccharide export system ATP-binding protein LptB [Bradyrhizobium ivorense]|uniref:Lipopolysaccharide export system ATP-binding protein LptB n=1 Tax=Bradyrhizobium ivorense TaxID=2511166 RepID=A0A508TFE2_9BRAD|nr:ABC transporter ATP-binding protein [Bradyrhizobium ivorense]VIO67804.1 Lipopolysaccharide export system ATP-binding protein LptB [Bradyrhizobium ivorense]VIO73180.1 Lipopolysaccharide export system ATP-binding protein LptB [Bradyrhizobium ivorense]
MSEPILTLSDVTVAFDALKAVDGVSLTVPRGQRRAIIGPNGAGKTTLFNAIAGAHPPTSGKVMFNGNDVSELPPHRRARLGISRTFQITNLFPTLSVQDNMMLALRGLKPKKFSLFGAPDPDEAEAARIGSALKAARIAERADVIVKEMSYGEQRQLEIAIALVTTPTMLLLDEPAAGLSPSERSMIAEVIRSLDPAITVILIEHDMDLALGLVDHVTCMFEGRVLVEEPPEGIRRNAKVQEVYLGKPRHA